jgi:adenosylcobinamide kinase/adenosylcobinamide-phosphate guanylyltransferase
MITTLVTGGARSGKSRHAEQLVGPGPATYVATGYPPDPADAEWTERVRRHQERRPAAWTTVETLEVAAAVRDATRPVLVDCLSLWLTRVIDGCDGWERPEHAATVVQEAGATLLEAWSSATVDVVLVTNEVGLGVVPDLESGRLFRDELGRLNAALSATADRVHLVVAGRVLDLSDAPVVGG